MAGARRLLSRWGLAALWAALPLAAGPALAAALDPADAAFRLVASVGLWAGWAAALAATLVPRPATLTAVRVVAPAAVAAVGWAALATPEPGWADALALAWSAAGAVVALSAATGERFVDGASYGSERRFPLRPPGPLLLGPVEAAWAVAVAGAVAGPLLLAAGALVPGALALVAGWPAAAVAVRALHGLARRCVVFVPAGLVLVDPATLAEPVAVQRGALERLGPAPAGTTALDLTAGALGLALEATFDRPRPVATAGRRGAPPAATEARRVLFSPTRPGRLLAEARARRLPVG